jgi:hypothetical protein
MIKRNSWAVVLSSFASALSITSHVELLLPPWAFEVDCPAAASERIVYEEPDAQCTIDDSCAVGRGTVKLTEHHLCWTSTGGKTFAFRLKNVVATMGSKAAVRCHMHARNERGDVGANFMVTLSSLNAEHTNLFDALDSAMRREMTSPGRARCTEALPPVAADAWGAHHERRFKFHAD